MDPGVIALCVERHASDGNGPRVDLKWTPVCDPFLRYFSLVLGVFISESEYATVDKNSHRFFAETSEQRSFILLDSFFRL